MSLNLAAVEAPRHLVKVSRKMLCRDSAPRSHDSALEQAECRFPGIRVNVAANIDTLPVLNRFVLGANARLPVSWAGF